MSATNPRIRGAARSATGVAAALALAGCGSSGSQESASTPSASSSAPSATATSTTATATESTLSSPTTPASSSAADHNSADEMFSMMMVPHHAQAIEMADLVPSRTDNAELRSLATQIKDAQQPEIDQMTGWLKSWGLRPMADMDEHMGHMGMDGMMTAEEMTELEGLSGKEFDTMWLEMMIRHHEGAIEMAQNVLDTGDHEPTKALAEAIITGQQAEIDQMKQMLAG